MAYDGSRHLDRIENGSSAATMHHETSTIATSRVTLTEARYAVVGSDWEQLRLAMTLTGPRRGGVRYLAYTQWRVVWSYRAAAVPEQDAFHVADGLVNVTATMTLPEWIEPRHVTPALRQRWADLVTALRNHELEHVQIAEQTAGAIGNSPRSRQRHLPMNSGLP
jgi:predicted secreted Zn-dependent protease